MKSPVHLPNALNKKDATDRPLETALTESVNERRSNLRAHEGCRETLISTPRSCKAIGQIVRAHHLHCRMPAHPKQE